MSDPTKVASQKPPSRYVLRNEFASYRDAMCAVIDVLLDSGQVPPASRAKLLSLNACIRQLELPGTDG